MKAIFERRSIRKYTSEDISENDEEKRALRDRAEEMRREFAPEQ